MKFSVPPVEKMLTPEAFNLYTISSKPSLSNTDIRAFLILILLFIECKFLLQFYPIHLENSKHLDSNKLIVDKLYLLLK